MQRFFILLCSLFPLLLIAQPVDLVPDRFPFEAGLEYDENIQSPAEFLGYELGERFTEYHRSVEYFKYLAEQSERITLNQYGETYEQRPLINLVVSSADNQQRMEELRERHLRLMDADFAASDEGKQVIENDPVFTSFSYNIHGNEASSTEAAMQIAYRLAAVNDTETQRVLRESVVLMFVCINPDGRDRYVYWINGASRNEPGINPRDFEHYAPWPNGRTNHYWFDLNRDWIWGVHPESRGHTGEYQRWMPQVHVDYHEQGYNANYFTAPGATPRNLLLPDSYEAWSDTFGRANIKAFDAEGLMYFTRDRFDFFYPGYGSSYPSVMGAIGMLTEQGGIAAGRAVTTDDGYVLTLRQRIFDHYTTSMATIRKSAAQRQALLNYSVAAWNTEARKSPYENFVIRNEKGGYLIDFLRMMQRQGVRIEQAAADFSQPASLDYRTGETKQAKFKKGDYIISTQQARHLFIHSIMDRNMAIEDSVMYDMSTWSAPLAYNLEAYATTGATGVKTTVVEEMEWLGQVNTEALRGRPAYAYVIDWQERWAPKALGELWAKDYRVRAAVAPFSDGQKEYSAGTLIVLRGRNLEREASLQADMQAIAASAQVTITALPTGRMREGADLASSRNRPVKQPRLAMLVEPPFDTYTAGQVYFLFDQETAFPIDRIRTSAFEQTSLPKFGQRYGYADINEYDVLILPGGRDLKKLFWQDQRSEISQWLQRGGTIIALEEAAEFFTTEGKFGKLEMVKSQTDTSEAAKYLTYADQEAYRGLRRIPGSALRTDIDTTHPLAFGVKPEVYGLKLNTTALQPANLLESVGVYHRNAEEMLTAGYASQANLKQLAGKTFAGVQRFGDGQIVYLLDNPHYRMFWRGNSRMVQNAAFLVPAF
jgi:hypothetical protein